MKMKNIPGTWSIAKAVETFSLILERLLGPGLNERLVPVPVLQRVRR